MIREYHQLEIPWFGGVVRIAHIVERDASPPSRPNRARGVINTTAEPVPGFVRAAVARLVPIRKSA
jgi:hypothetical protein